MSTANKIIIIVILTLAIGVAGGFFIGKNLGNDSEPAVNNNENVLEIPNQNENEDNNDQNSAEVNTDGWETLTDTTKGISYQYPRGLAAEYIDPVDWPPQAQIEAKPFSCTEAGTETQRAGATEQVNVNGRNYCITKVSEGAAGSTYIQYAYAFAKGNKVVTLTFSLRFPQCANYNDPQKTACQTERDTFNVNSVVDRVAQTIKLN